MIRYIAVITQGVDDIPINHRIEVTANVGDELIKTALHHWTQDYGGSIRSKVVAIEFIGTQAKTFPLHKIES
jgi:hypothetical protein